MYKKKEPKKFGEKVLMRHAIAGFVSGLTIDIEKSI